MRAALFILYYFPPSGGAGVQRGLKLVRYLREFDWEPIVLTVREQSAFPVRDESLLSEVPPDVRVYRTRCPEAYGAYRRLAGRKGTQSLDIATQSAEERRLHRRLLRWMRASFFIPDGRMAWLPFGVRAGVRIAREHDCRLLFSSGPPFTAHLIARALHRKTSLPWVADYRDPWTQATFYPRRPALARRWDLALEASCVREAARSLVVGETMAAEFRERYADLAPERFVVLPNGYDPADFGAAAYEQPGVLRITHAGSLFRNRVPESFLSVVEQLARADREFAQGVRLSFAGRLDAEMSARLSQPPLAEMVELPGYLPHGESVRLLRRSALLLLLVGSDAQSRSMVTGKVFEYLASGVPILVLGPHDGDAARLVTRLGAGWVCAQEDAGGQRERLLKIWRAFREQPLAAGGGPLMFGLEPDRKGIERFSRREQARELGQLFEGLA